MKTLILETPGNLVARETPHPGLPGPGEALVRVHRVGVCGTDIHAFHGRQPFFSYPRILGHELGVEVVAIGEKVERVKVGDRCAVEPYMNCGRCIACRRGKPNCCAELKVLGVHRDGGQREWLLVPAEKLHAANDLAYDQLALVETLGIGAHAVERARVEAGETVAVLGAGPIGLAAIQFALAARARVLVVDRVKERLDFCRDKLGLPASDLIDASVEEVGVALKARTDGDMPTAVFDATGNARSMAAAFDFPAQGGRLVFIGLFPGEVTFNDPNFHRRELTLLASRNALPGDFGKILALIRSGAIDTRPWITHRASLAEVPDVFAGWTQPESRVLKAMIEV
jgi:2-desacetyl-2-hydroxyethyl bacteriochlorophyllide A dehydrogenase